MAVPGVKPEVTVGHLEKPATNAPLRRPGLGAPPARRARPLLALGAARDLALGAARDACAVG
ncbi:hypothetical protein [Streptomyces sp. NPDC047841]|uniref:hypothetical protein n=1 Tax=Streptomyces sp. NPDC047841 TaxID=3154708 RepID=UPI0034529B0E